MGQHELEVRKTALEAVGIMIDTMRLLKVQIDRASDRNTNITAAAAEIRNLGETIVNTMFITVREAMKIDEAEADSNG